MHSTALSAFLTIVTCSLPGLCSEQADTVADLLDRMETAVLAGDAEAYLACVDTTVPEWSMEQTNWAADLADHTPEAFAISLRNELVVSEEHPETAEAKLRFTWTMPDARERHVDFPARFTHSDQDGWRYAGEAWTSVTSEDGQTIVRYLSDSLDDIATQITEMMPEIREHVDEGFETHLDHPQVVKLYTDMEHLQQSIYLSYVDPLGGWNEANEAIKIVASRGMSERQLRILLSHEYGHVATFTYHPDVAEHLPWWVAEGAAELAAERYSGSRALEGMNRAVRAWAESDSLAAWEDMADFRETPSQLHGHVYLQGHHFVGYISERFGRTARNTWIRRLASGVPMDEASEEVFGLPFEQLSTEWRESIAADD